MFLYLYLVQPGLHPISAAVAAASSAGLADRVAASVVAISGAVCIYALGFY